MTTDTIQTEALSFELELHHAPEKVWRALTEPDLLSQWILPVIGFTPTPGTEFVFKTEPQPGWDGVVNCRLIDVEPKKRLSWRWIVGDIDTVLTFTMAAEASGTRLSIVHAGFKPSQKRESGGARYGWKMMTAKLVDLLERIP